MPGPPPPPPMAPPPMGPPPPPFFSSSPSKSSGDNRGALLNSIRQGKRLKRAVTNDRSAPLVAGGAKAPSNSTNAPAGGGYSSKPSVPNGLGGLFSDGMPKLRPAGSRGDGMKSNNGGFSSLNSVNNSRNNTNTNPNSNGGSSLPHVPAPKTFNNFHNEVQSALKKQMASDSNRSRGPPPPAPTRNISQNIENYQNSEKHSYRAKLSNSNGLHLNVNNLHKSFANLPSPTSSPQTPKSFNSLQVNSSTLHRKANSSANLTLFDSSEISNNCFPSRPSNRKPHLAPKPPVLNGKPAPPAKRIINRAHSMRTPRSPSPQSPEDSTYPTKFGTVRNMTSMLDKAHHRTRPMLNGRPHQNPPPPPNKIVKPPNHAPPPPPNVIPQPPNHAPPPPPPTRTNSQFHQPQVPLRASPSIPPNSTAPPPPPRHLSMRDMINNKRVPHIDLDAKFRSEFRPIHQFPPPGVYRGLLKAYTSRTVGNKQQAPLPPNHIQINNRMWDSSTC